MERVGRSRHAPLFRAHEVFLVRSSDFDAFPHCRLPHSSSSVGLCASDGETRTYLHLLEPEGLGRVLRAEGSDFFDAPPLALAELFAELASEGLRPLPTVEDARVEARNEEWLVTFRSDIGRMSVRVSKDFVVTFDVTESEESAVDSDDDRLF